MRYRGFSDMAEPKNMLLNSRLTNSAIKKIKIIVLFTGSFLLKFCFITYKMLMATFKYF